MKKYVALENGVVVEKNEGKAVEIEVSYDLGNGYNSCRGMKLSLYPTEITDFGTCRSYRMEVFNKRNKRFVCEEMSRKNAKTIAKWENWANENLLLIMSKYEAGDYDGIMRLISEAA